MSQTSSAALRTTLDLSGPWDFEFAGPTTRLARPGPKIQVPGIWQAQFPELRNAHGTGIYRRIVQVPDHWSDKDIVLVLEGVFHETKVLVDGVEIGSHGNGWTTAEIDLTPFLKGSQQFALEIVANVPDDRGYARSSFGQTLAGKQDWYGIHGGIWKPARIEVRHRLHLVDVCVQTTTDLKSQTVCVTGSLSRPLKAELSLELSKNGMVVASHSLSIESRSFTAELSTTAAALWSPDAPTLYDVAIALRSDGVVVDTIDRVVGFRLLESRKGRLYFNGAPFFMFGALDQDWYPGHDSGHPSPEFLEQRFLNAKAMGLNTLRCHVKIPHQLYFDLADRLGLIVWLDMPYPQFLAPQTRDTLVEIFSSSVTSHGHHPSICLWTLFNEGWGIEQDDNPDDRRWLIEFFDAAKAKVPNALVVDNSPCFPRNYHLKTDIEDFHWYSGFPQQNAQFAQVTSDFAARASWPWSPHGDAVKSGLEALICSEFGVWGLPHPRDIQDADGREPWWFESGHDWNNGAGYPHGIEIRFRDAQLAPIFGDLDGFIDAAQELQYRALKFQIETLRWAKPISGYVITELNDVQWESNGLMDVRNNPRRFAARLANLQNAWLIMARPLRTTLRGGETLDVPVGLAGAATLPAGAILSWAFAGQTGSTPLVEGATVISLRAPSSDKITLVTLELEAADGHGQILSRNEAEFCIAPPVIKDAPRLFAADAKAASILTGLPWPNMANALEESDIVLATRLTSPVREHLLHGRRVLLIANDMDALVDPDRSLPRSDRHNFPAVEIHGRDGTPWDGRWMGAFSWRRTDGPWAAFPGAALLDEHWQGLIPRHVLSGFLSTAFGGLVDSGVAVAWLHKAAAFSKRSFLGKGWMTVSTFELTTPAALDNPLAVHLLRALAES